MWSFSDTGAMCVNTSPLYTYLIYSVLTHTFLFINEEVVLRDCKKFKITIDNLKKITYNNIKEVRTWKNFLKKL